jgi:dipeptidyl aminopeptidase/acylaminoacyl peptidase
VFQNPPDPFRILPPQIDALKRILIAAAALLLVSVVLRGESRDFDRQLRQQAMTDRAWRYASDGYMRMEKVSYRSSAGDLDIPAFVFRPLGDDGIPGSRPALVWVHEDVRGHLYEHYIPYVRDAVARGYVVIAPEYRGSIGYGEKHYDAIDYGGAEVDDVVTAVDVLRARYPEVDCRRVAIVGWSHGGLIALLSVFRNPSTFRSAAALVPVANLIERVERKGVERQLALIDPSHRVFGTSPQSKPEIYRERSPLFQVDKLRVPLLVHVARNDQDVEIDEDMPLVEALRAQKPNLAVTKVYDNPMGGHTFDRRVNHDTWQPENNPEQVDSWKRVWHFLDRTLRNASSSSDPAFRASHH